MTQGQLAKLAYVLKMSDQIEVIQDDRDGWEASAHYAGAMLMQERDLLKEALKEINEALKLEGIDVKKWRDLLNG